MAQRGEFTQENEESTFIAITIAGLVFLVLGWYFVGKYVYAYERLALYWVLSLGGMIPTDWFGWGWVTRQYLFFRYTAAEDISFVDHAVGDSMLVNMVLFVVLLIYAMRKFFYIEENHPFSIYGRQMNLYDYVFDQMNQYPHLKLMWRLHLLARPLDKGLFRMSESAKQFCVNKNLVGLPAKNGEPVVDEMKADAVFRSHLGRLIPIPTDDPVLDAKNLLNILDNNEKAILAAIVPRLASCDEETSDKEYDAGIKLSEKLVVQFWRGYDNYTPQPPSDKQTVDLDCPLIPPPPPVDTSGCDEVLMKYLPHPMVRASMLNHAYVRTFIYDSIQACRRIGKFPPAPLRWVMMLDRTLWLTLSSAGRREPFWECAGVHAHYLYERKAGKAVERPQVRTATEALVDELAARMVFSAKEKTLLWEAQTGDVLAMAKLGNEVREQQKVAAAKAVQKAIENAAASAAAGGDAKAVKKR